MNIQENIQGLKEDPIRKIDDKLTIYHSKNGRVIKVGDTSASIYIDPFSKDIIEVSCRKATKYFKETYNLEVYQVVNLVMNLDKDASHTCPVCGTELRKPNTLAYFYPKTCSHSCSSILKMQELKSEAFDGVITKGAHSFSARAKANRTKFQALGNMDDVCYLYLAVHEDFPDWYKFGVSDQHDLDAKAHRNGYSSITKIVEGTRLDISNLEYRLAIHFKSEWFQNSEDALREFNYITSELVLDKAYTKVVKGVRLNFIDPSITLINSIDNRKEVWRISRPHLDPDDEKINDIQNLDLPVNGFAFYFFKITSSLLVRDLLYHVRPSQDWARSNRTTLITDKTLNYSGEYSDEKYWSESELEAHWKSIDQAVNQDIRKHNFMYSVSTTYCWAIDARTLSGVIRSLKVSALSEYANMFMSALGISSVDELVPGREDFLYQYAIDDLAIDRIVESNSNAVADYYPEARQLNVISKMTGALLSQFIRQAYSIVRTDLINDIVNAKSFDELPKFQSDVRIGQVLISTEKAKKLVLTRTCWFGMFDQESLSSWSHIVVAIMTALQLTPEETLICEGCADKCKWKAEQLARLKAGNPNGSIGETNPPCIILTGIPELYELRQQKFGSNSALFRQWKRLIPDGLTLTEEGKEYLSNVAEYGYAETRDNEALKGITEEILTKYKITK